MSKFLKTQFKGLNKSILFNPFKKKDIPTPNSEVEAKQVKETLTKKFKNYLLLVFNDYKQVGYGTLVHAKNHPAKTTLYGLLTGAFVVAYKFNPDYQHYIETRRTQANEMIMCSSSYNRKTEHYLNCLNKLEYCNNLEYKSYFVFSLILVRNFSLNDSTYEKQCAQLNNPNKYNIFNYSNLLLRFLSRVVDIGFLNNWYFLNSNFRDFDINEEEWK